jgi:tetratricopeptide (TPR) repeat protein
MGSSPNVAGRRGPILAPWSRSRPRNSARPADWIGWAPTWLPKEAPVYQRDYLMRQIEQIGQMLAHILGLAKGGRGDEALGMFDEAYKPLIGVGSRVVAALDEGQLVDLLTSGSNPDMRRVALALELLKAEGDLYAEAGQAGEAAIRHRRAVALAGCLAARSERLLDRDLAAGLLERAAELELSTAQRLAGAWVLEALARYADAEDALFELIDEDPDDPEPVEEAIAFCQRLRPLEPEQLVAGGLTHEEVTDTLAELLRRQAVPDPDREDDDELPLSW